ncbi:hypothetical protein H5410_004833, partial [Solanum commersonii]
LKQVKSEESTRPKSKILELKLFESLSSSKTLSKLRENIFSENVLRRSHSAQLVGIANTLGDPSFGLLHLLLAFDFTVFASWINGRYRLSTLEQKARIRPFGDSPNGFGDSQIFLSPFFQRPLFLLAK